MSFFKKQKEKVDEIFSVKNKEDNYQDTEERNRNSANDNKVANPLLSNNTNANVYKKENTYTPSGEISNKSNIKTKANIHRIDKSAKTKFYSFEPKSLEDAKRVIEYLNNDYGVVINLENTDASLSQRIIDVVTGALFLLDGDYSIVTQDIYMLAPKGIELISPLNNINSADETVEKTVKSNTFEFKK